MYRPQLLPWAACLWMLTNSSNDTHVIWWLVNAYHARNTAILGSILPQRPIFWICWIHLAMILTWYDGGNFGHTLSICCRGVLDFCELVFLSDVNVIPNCFARKRCIHQIFECIYDCHVSRLIIFTWKNGKGGTREGTNTARRNILYKKSQWRMFFSALSSFFHAVRRGAA